jgi:KDO2-lipid IV(A) lauroyltransferase
VHVSAWEGEVAGDPLQAARQVNAAMERLVRAGPQQYLWGYARYKQPREELAA